MLFDINASLRRPTFHAFRRAAPRLARAFSLGSARPLEEPIAGRLRAAQVATVARYSAATLAGNILVAFVLFIVLQYRESCLLALPWLCADVLLTAPALYRLFARRHRSQPLEIGRAATAKTTANSAVMGAIWGAAPAMFFDAARPDHLIVTCVAVGMACAGALALATLPRAMIAYTVPMIVGCLIGLARGATDPIHYFVLPLLLAYFAVIIGAALTHGRQFAARVIAQARAESAALHDPLTGLPNRTALDAALDAAFRRLGRYGEGFALLYIDLDDFKTVNDTLGHQAGDQLLQQVAGRLSGCLREGDMLARLGGDEFVMLARGVCDAPSAAAIARRAADVFETIFHLGAGAVDCRASVGVALAPSDGADVEKLLSHADTALYQAKHERLGAPRLYHPARHEEARARRALAQDLKGALARNEFHLQFQPIWALPERRIVSIETLARWRQPERGLVSPARFIPIAEETGAIHEIGEWIMFEACREATLWPDEVSIAVNVSAAQICDHSIVSIVEGALRASGLPPQRLHVEVTESATLAAGDGTARALERLHDCGVAIVLDDFGTGYSSFDHIRRLPVSGLKIDRSFVVDLPARKSRAIVQGVVQIAQALDIDVTAEGVETTTQLDFIHAAGCRRAQGYLLARPLEPAAARALMGRAAA